MSQPSSVRFGVFELDTRTGELRKHGVRLKIQDQPFQVLQALLERPGELVTREELQTRIWANDTFVDFDQSLNRAINKVREALSDTAGAPRFVETLPRRGYRFIAPVEAVPKIPPAAAAPPPEPAPPTASTARSYRRFGWVSACFLVAGAGAGLWFARDGGVLPPQRVTPLTTLSGNEFFPAFSPDGKHVAFTWNGNGQNNDDVYVKVVGDETPLRLTSDPAPDWFPAWSPDGKHIAFARMGGHGGIFLVSPLTGPERQLAGLVTRSRPSWSADGKFLIVAQQYLERTPAPGDGALFLIPVASGGERQILTPPHGTWYRDPTYAPSGRMLAFLSCTGPVGGPSCTLQVTGLKEGVIPSGDPRPIGKYTNPFGIAWSADESSLIYGSEGYLWRVGVRSGKEAERLELAGRGALGPAVDSKSSRLAFSLSTGKVDIWRLERDGRASSFLSSSRPENEPQYSPDGQRIAFESGRGGEGMAIWIANADGTGVNQITRIASPKCANARWSPDGKRIAFAAAGKAGGWTIWVADVSGASARQLTNGPEDNIIPSWSRDGSWVYFTSKLSGKSEIWRVPAYGGKPEQVTHIGGFVAFESTEWGTLYFTISEAGTEGLYSKRLPNGEERQVTKERVAALGFAPFSDGVYYINGDSQSGYDIRFHEFASGRVKVISKIQGPLGTGLAVSPDRKTFLFSKAGGLTSDLMLIENFR